MIIVKRSSIIIQPYNEFNRSPQLESLLSVWNKSRHESKPIGLYYDNDTETLRIPRGISVRKLKNTFPEDIIDIDKSFDEVSKVSIKLTTNPLNDKQKECIQFLLSKGDYEELSGHSRMLLEADTGVGKTYCTIATIAYSKVKSAIILNKDGLIEQWKDRLLKFTNLDESEIGIIKGSKSIKELLKGKYKKLKIFLISIKTINAYAGKNGWESITEVFEKLKIGIKVFDEAHLDFANIIKIDLFTNTRRTLYLTATAKRSDHNEDKVYKTIFANVPVLRLLRTKEEAYVKSYIVTYMTEPSKMTLAAMKNTYGLNSNKYLDYCFKGGGKEKFFEAVNVVFNTVYNREGKIAMLVGRRYAGKLIKDYLVDLGIPSKEIGIYNSDIKDKEKKQKQLDKHIILTTYKSFGTGMDISNLRYLINCEPYSSKVIARQMIGRLRDIGGDVYYFEILDEGIHSRANQNSNVIKEILAISEFVKRFQLP